MNAFKFINNEIINIIFKNILFNSLLFVIKCLVKNHIEIKKDDNLPKSHILFSYNPVFIG